jgi:hypothetical protein
MDKGGYQIGIDNKYRTVFNSTAQEEIILVWLPAAATIARKNGAPCTPFFQNLIIKKRVPLWNPLVCNH